MLKATSNKFQLESLRKTISTKEQIIDIIQSATIQELNAIIPESESIKNKKAIIDNVEIALNSNQPLDLTDATTEAIIQKIGRPVLLINNNLPVIGGTEVIKFKDLIINSIEKFQLSSKINSVGRIETDNLPGYDWLGTGWLFDEDLLITNRHVAAEFVESIGTGYSFKRFIGDTVVPRIDFVAEYNNANSAEFKIIKCLYMGTKNDHDIAIFKIKTLDNTTHLPISVLNGNPRLREDVAVIGYPAFDSRTGSISDMERIYQNIFDVKRFAVGKITNVYETDGVALHDATTLGGNSGSVVLSLETGKAIALHFSGKEGFGNYAVTSDVIRKVINKLPKSNYSLGQTNNSDTLSNINDLELVPRSCKLETYNPIKVPSYKISGRFITYATPDSTYAATKELFDQANETILIGIYDFSAEHMVIAVKNAIDRGVKVSLMLDIDSEKENEVFKKLSRYGVECVPAPSCASKNVNYFSSSHEKVIVIDGMWTLIQSGNYSNNSIPFNESDGVLDSSFKTGNRDMGIAIESRTLAKFFTNVLRSDMQLENSGSGEELPIAKMPFGDFLLEAPTKKPSVLFPSKEFNFNSRVLIQPILSPDNYMDDVLKLLATAKKSIKIEQQYIRVGQKYIDKLLSAITNTKKMAGGEFTVQIIVAPPIGDKQKTFNEVNLLKEMGFEVLLLSNKHFVHCHNKLIIIDDEAVLISSQNWSDSAVTKNREAGVVIYNKEITEYYSKIFDADWTMSEVDIEEIVPSEIIYNLEAISSESGKYVIVDACDIQEV